MVWVPPGTLIAGTPPGKLPRIADQELPGEKFELRGFFIDRFNYPGEAGAIPETGMTQAAARAICEKQGKRLCTELEWERACKGPDNFTYEYGETYDGGACGMDATDALAPNGLNTRCESTWGVRDLHGTAWTWTSSPWGRGVGGSKVAVRGGFGKNGALVGRCANARPVSPSERDGAVGVRCCAGEVNPAEVALEVTHKTELLWKPPTTELATQLENLAPEELRKAPKGHEAERFRVERTWIWRPIGNEELLVGGGCAKKSGADACGVLVARMNDAGPELLAWVSSDEWIATVGRHELARGLYVYGGDRLGAYRKAVMFDWGKVSEGRKERKKGSGWVRPPDAPP
jgi:sulfatase modifying factor 1